MNDLKVKYSDINWGEDEAKNDNFLGQYFVEFPGFNKVLKGEKRYIIGRKGTGKSAILQRIRIKADSDSTFFHTDISLRDFPLTDFRALGDRSLQDKSKYVSAWEFLLLTEIANLVIQDNSIEDNIGLECLKKFIKDNFPEGISITDTINQLKSNKNQINIASLGVSAENNTSNEISAKIHYNKAVKKIKSTFQSIKTESTFLLLIDELDEGYQVKNNNLNLIILSLLRASDEIFNFFKGSIKCIPILALRSDIYDSLEDNDLNKIDDYILRLNWTTDENSPWSLKKIVEKRIETTIKKTNPEFSSDDYWGLIADDSNLHKGLFQYICTLTFSRPRDIIKLLKYCSDVIEEPRLTISTIRKVENDYSDWFYREFKDEVHSFLPCWKSALNCISEIAKGKEKTTVLINKLKENKEISKWCQENKATYFDIIRTLFNYSVIGCINENGRWIFKYKDAEYFNYMESYPYYCVHFGFCRKLRIQKSYNRNIIDILRSYK